MVVPGKPELELRLLQEADHAKLLDFCNSCKKLGWYNNESFQTIKLDKMSMPYGQFFIGYDHSKDIIWNLAGVHKFPEVGEDAWRCLFRGAQLPGYSLSGSFTKDVYKNGYHLSYLLPMQMEFIRALYPKSKFYMSSNNLTNKTHFAKSQKLDSVIMPYLAKRGIFTCTHKDFMLYGTSQSVWQVNVDQYYKERTASLGVDFF